MVMQRIRPVSAYNTGATQMSQAVPASNISATGNLAVSGGGSSVGMVMGVVAVVLVVLYVATHGIQGSV